VENAIISKSPVRNRIGWRQRLSQMQGGAIRLDLRRYDASLAEINRLEDGLQDLSDAELRTRALAFRDAVRADELQDSMRCTWFALVREAARRTLGLRAFDVQVVAALAMDGGAIVDMQTGEGKTLAAVMPASLNALTGQGVHVLTFNEYLARRDDEWMGPVYRLLGLSCDCVQESLSTAARRSAYHADVTYVTAKEAGFDYLRDGLATDPGRQVHRPFHFALVDEADSLMIDEARVPLVIAGHVGTATSTAPRLADLTASLSPGFHFDTDEYCRDVELTEAGIEHIERVLRCGSLHSEENLPLLTQLNCALHARVLLRRDVDYIVRGGRIEIIDEFTGRVVEDRHWPDGLQTALEAKECLVSRAEGRVLDSMTLRRYLHGYRKLAGMTGTAARCASELREFYGVEVVIVPTHRPMIRIDHPDVVFTRRKAKERALVAEIGRAAQSGRPVLVGTLTVEESERIASLLRATDIPCQVLNAKNDAVEARIVARAGAVGSVTISTNMAGRGTDIRLGGEDEIDRDRVAALGGLYVIGTNRHESRRVDLQLRGRAGRQGDPGESRFFVSLEDDLLVRYGVQGLIASRFVPGNTVGDDEPIANVVVRTEIARTQRIIEGQNFEIRKTLSRYASIVEEQQAVIRDRRQSLLLGEMTPDIWHRAPERRAALVAAAGEEAVQRAERAITLFHLDSAWRDHLAFCADLREGIHLVRLGGQDPLSRFTRETMSAFTRIEVAIDDAVLTALKDVRISGDALDIGALGIQSPSSTWTYLVNDDPFRNQIGMALTGAGNTTIAAYAAAVLMPLLVLWGYVDKFLRKRPERRSS
jgi:preprotein translocase subunit SecA